MQNALKIFLCLLPVIDLALAGVVLESKRQIANSDDDNGSGIPDVGDADNAACVPWYAVRDAIMGDIFHGRCNPEARASVRLAFHDAGTFSQSRQSAGLPGSGADGSILTDPSEVLRAENNGLQLIVSLLRPLPARFGVQPGDVVQLAGVLGVLACPGGPVIPHYIGRTPPLNIAPDGLLPDVHASVPSLVSLFADKGFDERELMALIGAHSTSRQKFVDVAAANRSQDSTPEIWDVRFYSETQKSSTPAGVFKLPSDVAFSRHSATKKDYERFIRKQDNWAREYADAHEKMSLLGQNRNNLIECTEILPSMIELEEISDDDGDNSGSGGSGDQDPIINPAKLEAALRKYRSIWLD